MQLNNIIDKCVIIQCKRPLSPIKTDYKLNDDIIRTQVNIDILASYILYQTMYWSHYITTMSKKANKSLNFIVLMIQMIVL